MALLVNCPACLRAAMAVVHDRYPGPEHCGYCGGWWRRDDVLAIVAEACAIGVGREVCR